MSTTTDLIVADTFIHQLYLKLFIQLDGYGSVFYMVGVGIVMVSCLLSIPLAIFSFITCALIAPYHINLKCVYGLITCYGIIQSLAVISHSMARLTRHEDETFMVYVQLIKGYAVSCNLLRTSSICIERCMAMTMARTYDKTAFNKILALYALLLDGACLYVSFVNYHQTIPLYLASTIISSVTIISALIYKYFMRYGKVNLQNEIKRKSDLSYRFQLYENIQTYTILYPFLWYLTLTSCAITTFLYLHHFKLIEGAFAPLMLDYGVVLSNLFFCVYGIIISKERVVRFVQCVRKKKANIHNYGDERKETKVRESDVYFQQMEASWENEVKTN